MRFTPFVRGIQHPLQPQCRLDRPGGRGHPPRPGKGPAALLARLRGQAPAGATWTRDELYEG